MKYLILMTVAGSILLIGYLCWNKVLGSFLTHSMRYRALVFVVLVYVIPWVWLKGIYGNVARWFFRVRVPVISGHPITLADIATEGEAYVTPDYLLQLLIVGVWIAGALTMLAHKSVSYLRNKRQLLSVAKICEGPEMEAAVVRLRKEMRYKGRFEVVIMPGLNGSFTLGAVKPVVFLQEDYSEGQLYYILKHEMIHIIRKDLALKLLLEFACCLHWFNPLIQGLNHWFDDICEASCDERVLKGSTEDESWAYARLLVDNLKKLEQEKAPHKRIPFQSSLTDACDKTRERVNLIMNAKAIKNWKKRLAASVFAVLVAANSLTALAYPNVYHVKNGDTEVAEDTVEGNAFWAGEQVNDGYNKSSAAVVYDDEFIDMDGNVSPVNQISPYIFCIKHDIVSGYYQTHRKNDEGGCTVKIYESTKCLICNTIWVGDLVSTHIYVKCPH